MVSGKTSTNMIHGPKKQNEMFLWLINMQTLAHFEDCSYGNDCTDSIWCEKYQMKIFLPNNPNPFQENNLGEESFSTFTIQFVIDEETLEYEKHFNLQEIMFLVKSLENQYVECDKNGDKLSAPLSLYELIQTDWPNGSISEWEEIILPLLMMKSDEQRNIGTELMQML